MTIQDKEIVDMNARVLAAFISLKQQYPDRWNRVLTITGVSEPTLDLGYACALLEWKQIGSPKESFYGMFNTKEKLKDPYLIEFRDEIKEMFGLRILTYDEICNEYNKTRLFN
jgi:hypothetical protein